MTDAHDVERLAALLKICRDAGYVVEETATYLAACGVTPAPQEKVKLGMGHRIVRSSFCIALILLAGCIPKPGLGAWSPIGSFPTVEVRNHSLDPVRVYAVAYGADRYMGTVMAGETRCLRLPFSDMTYNLRARSLSGEVTSAAFQPDRPGGWAWTLNEGLRAHDGLSLVPAEGPCVRSD